MQGAHDGGFITMSNQNENAQDTGHKTGLHTGQSSGQKNASTVIGAGTTITGEMTFESDALILGDFEGTLNAKGSLTVGIGGRCKAAVRVAQAVIEGSLSGDLSAEQRIELRDSAQVQGDLTAPSLTVAEGACFTGHCAIGAVAASPKHAKPSHTITESKAISLALSEDHEDEPAVRSDKAATKDTSLATANA
jgi:cytoskeletal protein CcmA (bactofilin family)